MDDNYNKKHEKDVPVPYPQNARCKAELETWRTYIEGRLWTMNAGKALSHLTHGLQ